MRFYLNSMVLLMSVFFPLQAEAQITEQAAKTIAARSACGANLPSPAKALRVTRREDLEDDLVALQGRYVKNVFKGAYFFEISATGYFVISGELINVEASHGGGSKILLAISSENGQEFPLFGCNAHEGFEGLNKANKLKVNDIHDATQFIRLFYKLTEDPDQTRIIITSMDLKHKIEDYFYQKFQEKEAGKKFASWWKGYEKVEKRISLSATAKKVGNGYKSFLTFYTFNGNIPIVKQMEISIFVDGNYRVEPITSVYPANM